MCDITSAHLLAMCYTASLPTSLVQLYEKDSALLATYLLVPQCHSPFHVTIERHRMDLLDSGTRRS